MAGMNIPRTTLADVYNGTKIASAVDEITDFGSRIHSLEIQVEHLRTLNRALIEHMASNSDLSPHEFLERLSLEHPAQSISETTHCKSCGTLIASDAKACYSCGKLLESDAYILG